MVEFRRAGGTLLAQIGNHRKSRDAAVFDFPTGYSRSTSKTAQNLIDFNAVHVAGHGRVGPNLQNGPVGPKAGQRKRNGYVQIGWKTLGSVTRGALEYLKGSTMPAMSMLFSTR
jgi:hypothetical protein